MSDSETEQNVSRLIASAQKMSKEQLNSFITSITKLDIPISKLSSANKLEPSSGPSQFYGPRGSRLPGFPDPPADQWGDWDEYRDDLDPGYRIRELHVVSEEDELMSARSGNTSLSNTGNFPGGLLSGQVVASSSNSTPTTPVTVVPVIVSNSLPNFGERSESPVFGRASDSPHLSTFRYDIFGAREAVPLSQSAGAAAAVAAEASFAALHLRVEFERGKSGLEPERERTYQAGERVGASYVVQEPLGCGAFSSAYAAVRTGGGEGGSVCLKVVKNVKDFVDQGLDEVRVLLHLEEAARKKKSSLEAERIVRLYDFFYFREHLFIVTERLYENLYEYQRYCKSAEVKYFSLGRVQKITAQLVRALSFIHTNNIVSCDLKPENVLFESYQEALVKLIDFGNASFRTDATAMASTYVQSRCYRAPEVILGLPYTEKIDIWSLGCVMAEMFTGYVLFQCERIEGMLARIVGIIGELPEWMMNEGRFVDKYFINKADIKDDKNILVPKRTSLWQRLRSDDVAFVDFVCRCLQLDPTIRPSAQDLASHEFLKSGRFADGI